MKPIIHKLGMLAAMLLVFLQASAYDFKVDGIYYNVVSLPDLTCRVVAGNFGYAGDIVIPANVTYKNKTLTVVSISDKAFYLCRSLTSVEIPNSVTEIGSYAFSGCSILSSVEIGNSVTSIGERAFEDCSSLTSVEISNSVTEIGSYAFEDCSSLSSVEIGNSVTSIGESAFKGCSSLVSVTIPNSVTSIGVSAFGGCSSLVSVTIPNSVTSIGRSAFYGCSNLASVTIPNSVTSIGDWTFEGCSSLDSVTIPNSVTSIGVSAFEGCSSLDSVTIPNSVTSIGRRAFYGCSSLVSVEIGNSVTSIGDFTFNGCSSLASVAIPNSVTSIGEGTFANCDNLKAVSFLSGSSTTLSLDDYFDYYYKYYYSPIGYKTRVEDLFIGRTVGIISNKALTDVGPINVEFGDDINVIGVFDRQLVKERRLESITLGKNVSGFPTDLRDCRNLKEFTIKAEIPPVCPEFTNVHYMNMIVYVPEGCLAAYQNAEGWKNFWDIREKNLSGVEIPVVDATKTEIGRCDLYGRPVGPDYRGFVIVRFSDGTSRKTMQR